MVQQKKSRFTKTYFFWLFLFLVLIFLAKIFGLYQTADFLEKLRPLALIAFGFIFFAGYYRPKKIKTGDFFDTRGIILAALTFLLILIFLSEINWLS